MQTLTCAWALRGSVTETKKITARNVFFTQIIQRPARLRGNVCTESTIFADRRQRFLPVFIARSLKFMVQGEKAPHGLHYLPMASLMVSAI